MFGRLPARHISATFANEPQSGVWPETVDLCEIDTTEQGIERGADLEVGLVGRMGLVRAAGKGALGAARCLFNDAIVASISRSQSRIFAW
jgi:hypothetical protein